jgi:hypothetical protein
VLAIDHVIVVVPDLDSASSRLHAEHGLASVAGGRHRGHGTGNRIVPLGSSYLELIAVVDQAEAEASSLGSWVSRRLAVIGEGPAALCLRTDDIAAVARSTGQAPRTMTRTRPDGVELRWQLVGLDAAFGEGLPFYIRWDIDDADHPGRELVEHRCRPTGIEWVELGGQKDLLDTWLEPHDLPLRHVDGAPGPHRIAIALATDASTVIA